MLRKEQIATSWVDSTATDRQIPPVLGLSDRREDKECSWIHARRKKKTSQSRVTMDHLYKSTFPRSIIEESVVHEGISQPCSVQ